MGRLRKFGRHSGYGVRGAPAIGVAAAYGMTRAVQDACSDLAVDWELVSQKIATLRASRPTAVKFDVAIDRMAAH